MRYKYTAKKGPEEVVKGVIDAVNRDNAVTKVRQLGLYPMAVEKLTQPLSEQTGEAGGKKKKKTLSTGGRISAKHIYFFTKRLKTLLKSQEPLLGSLYFIEDQVDNAAFKKVIQEMIGSVREGGSFSEALERFPRYFSPLYVSIIKAGEAGGNLDYSLEQITKYMDNDRKLAQKVMSALAYPIMMVSVGIVAVLFIITFVIPKLEPLFSDFMDKLPLATKLLLSFSDFFSAYWMIILLVLAGAVGILFFFRKARWFKNIGMAVKTGTPVIKDIIYYQSLYRLASGLSILLSSGVSLLNSIRISIPLVEDEKAQQELTKVYDHIVSGMGLEESLRENCSYLPDMFIKMVAVGEMSGRLEEVLMELANGYSEEVDSMTKIVTSLIEPLAIVAVGSVLGFIVISILLPIFEISMFVQ